MAAVIHGKKISKSVRDEIEEATHRMKREKGIVPGLADVLSGDDPASQIYARGKNVCDEAGFLSKQFKLSGDTTEAELLDSIDGLNRDRQIHGFLVQLSVPKHIGIDAMIETIDRKRDVDAFHPCNVGRLCSGNPYHSLAHPRVSSNSSTDRESR